MSKSSYPTHLPHPSQPIKNSQVFSLFPNCSVPTQWNPPSRWLLHPPLSNNGIIATMPGMSQSTHSPPADSNKCTTEYPLTNFTVLSRVPLWAGTLILVRAGVAAGTSVQTRWVSPTIVQIWNAHTISNKPKEEEKSCMREALHAQQRAQRYRAINHPWACH